MKSFHITIVAIIVMIAGAACSGSGPGVLQFGSSASTPQPTESNSTAEATSPATEPPATATTSVPPELDPTEEQEATTEPTSEWPDGSYTVTHDEGSMVCPSGLNQTIPAGDVTVGTLTWQNGGQALELSGFEGQTMLFTRSESGAGGFSMVSQGVYGGVPMTFTLYFFYGIEWIEGTIEGEIEGCSVNRSFVASPN